MQIVILNVIILSFVYNQCGRYMMPYGSSEMYTECMELNDNFEYQ